MTPFGLARKEEEGRVEGVMAHQNKKGVGVDFKEKEEKKHFKVYSLHPIGKA